MNAVCKTAGSHCIDFDQCCVCSDLLGTGPVLPQVCLWFPLYRSPIISTRSLPAPPLSAWLTLHTLHLIGCGWEAGRWSVRKLLPFSFFKAKGASPHGLQTPTRKGFSLQTNISEWVFENCDTHRRSEGGMFAVFHAPGVRHTSSDRNLAKWDKNIKLRGPLLSFSTKWIKWCQRVTASPSGAGMLAEL